MFRAKFQEWEGVNVRTSGRVHDGERHMRREHKGRHEDSADDARTPTPQQPRQKFVLRVPSRSDAS